MRFLFLYWIIPVMCYTTTPVGRAYASRVCKALLLLALATVQASASSLVPASSTTLSTQVRGELIECRTAADACVRRTCNQLMHGGVIGVPLCCHEPAPFRNASECLFDVVTSPGTMTAGGAMWKDCVSNDLPPHCDIVRYVDRILAALQTMQTQLSEQTWELGLLKTRLWNYTALQSTVTFLTAENHQHRLDLQTARTEREQFATALNVSLETHAIVVQQLGDQLAEVRNQSIVRDSECRTRQDELRAELNAVRAQLAAQRNEPWDKLASVFNLTAQFVRDTYRGAVDDQQRLLKGVAEFYESASNTSLRGVALGGKINGDWLHVLKDISTVVSYVSGFGLMCYYIVGPLVVWCTRPAKEAPPSFSVRPQQPREPPLTRRQAAVRARAALTK